jgi:hypothetical protein
VPAPQPEVPVAQAAVPQPLRRSTREQKSLHDLSAKPKYHDPGAPPAIYDAIVLPQPVFFNTNALDQEQGKAKLQREADAEGKQGKARAAGGVNEAVSKPKDKPASVPPPKTFKQALKSPWRADYLAAAKKEYDGHMANGTWELVPRASVPPGKNILRGKWVFDDKRDERGRLIKYKARFVAKGYTQKYGEDYQETFAGVVIGKSFRIMLAMLNANAQHSMEHWDVRMAFTQAELDEELFMEQPEGFEQGKEEMVCKLRKSLYGLKQSAYNWQRLLKDIMHAQGFYPLKADPCVYVKRSGGGAWVVCSTHVDDIFILCNSAGRSERARLWEAFSARVQIENLGPVAWALNTQVLRDVENGVLKISQERYINEVLELYYPQLQDAACGPRAAMKTPYYTKPPSDDDAKPREELKKEMQSKIGALWWIAQISRPDIMMPLHLCSKEISKPTQKLVQRLDSIFKYLSNTKSMGLIYQRPSLDTPILSAFVDASFAGEASSASRIGYFYFFQGNLISWASENAKRIMTSSTEAECYGLYELARENVWQRQMQAELPFYEVIPATVAYEDNQSSLALLRREGPLHKRVKHFGVNWDYVKECEQRGEMRVVYLQTEAQAADLLTKPIPGAKFNAHRATVMGDAQMQEYFDD